MKKICQLGKKWPHGRDADVVLRRIPCNRRGNSRIDGLIRSKGHGQQLLTLYPHD